MPVDSRASKGVRAVQISGCQGRMSECARSAAAHVLHLACIGAVAVGACESLCLSDAIDGGSGSRGRNCESTSAAVDSF